MDSIDSRLQKLETAKQPRDWSFYNIIRTLQKYSSIFKNTKLFEETKNKDDTDPNLICNFCSTTFLSKPYGYSFFIRAFRYGCGSALDRSMSIIISLIAGPFDDFLSWPFRGTLQISVFRQDISGLMWTNLLKTNDKTTPYFSQPSPLQPNPSCGILFYIHHEEIFKAHKNLIKNDNVYIQKKDS